MEGQFWGLLCLGHCLNSTDLTVCVCSTLGMNEINSIKCIFISLDHSEFDSFSEQESPQNNRQKEPPFLGWASVSGLTMCLLGHSALGGCFRELAFLS